MAITNLHLLKGEERNEALRQLGRENLIEGAEPVEEVKEEHRGRPKKNE